MGAIHDGDGRVDDPLNTTDTGDNYGVILLADVMLKVARRTGDSTLEADRHAHRRLGADAAGAQRPLQPACDRRGDPRRAATASSPPSAWEQSRRSRCRLGRADRSSDRDQLSDRTRLLQQLALVWSAGAALLLADGVAARPGTLAGPGPRWQAQIQTDLEMALANAGAPLRPRLRMKPRAARAERRRELLTQPPARGTRARAV